jgi:hypothetical protein
MSHQTVCDICKRALNVGDINIVYKKVRARKHAFDGWSSTYTHNVDVCDRCIKKIEKLVNKDITNLCGCGFANECAMHCNHTLKACPGKAFKPPIRNEE